jgi:hypothetical protein
MKGFIDITDNDWIRKGLRREEAQGEKLIAHSSKKKGYRRKAIRSNWASHA